MKTTLAFAAAPFQLPRAMKTIRSLVAAAFALLAPSLDASLIAWSTSAVSGPGDVRLDGALVGAMNVGTTTADGVPTQVVNGVPFVSEPGGAGALALGSATVQFSFANNLFNDFWVLAAPGGSAEYDRALDYGRTQDGGTRSGTVTLGGLVVGRSYLVQLWVADRRGCCDSRNRTVDGVATNAVTANIVTGTFTADAVSQVITIVGVGGTDHGPQVNMLQLRETARPPLVVTSAGDADAGSLRAALDTAAAQAGADTIVFDAALNGQTIALSTFTDPFSFGNAAFNLVSGEVVTVDATALSAGVKIDAGSQGFRFFQINAGASLTLHGLTLANGGGNLFIGIGGAIRNLGTLALAECALSGNRTVLPGGSGYGGAIGNTGTATLTRCTLSNNEVQENGGAIYNFTNGTLTMTHCTVSGNTSRGFSRNGGICNASGLTTLTHCTISGNSSGVASNGSAVQTVVQNCIISGNTGSSVDVVSGTTNNFTSLGGNLVGSGTTTARAAFTTAMGDIFNNTPNLASLAAYGGRTQTRPPLPGSPALDVAVVLVPPITTDQRAAAIVGAPDIGATESLSGPVNAVVTSNADAGSGSLRNILAAVPTGSSITFDPAIFTGATATTNTILLTTSASGSAFTITKAVTIDATSLSGGVKIDGTSQNFRHFQVNAGASLTLHGLTLVNGVATGSAANGGAIFNNGTLTLTRCTLSNNHADVGRGGAVCNTSTAVMAACTFSDNSALDSGGAIYTLAPIGPLTLMQCTLSRNTTTVGYGGAIRSSGGRMNLTHCTISGNTAQTTGTGGVFISGAAGTSTRVQNCIIVGNSYSDVDNLSDAYVPFTSLGHNIVGSGSATAEFSAVGDLRNGIPDLAALADNGGPTQTMARLANSPARNAAAVLAPPITSDQRGFPIVGLPDIGAFELPNTTPTAPNGTATATTGDSKNITLPAFDVDGDTLTITGTTPGSGLTVNSTSGLDVTFTPATNSVGDATLGYTVSDGTNSASGTITVTVTDNDAPSISGTFSPLIVVAGVMPDYRSQAIVSDNASTPTVTQDPLPGSTTVAGVMIVTVRATDAAGNFNQHSFDLDVRPLAPVHTPHLLQGAAAPGAGTNGLPANALIASFNQPATSEEGDVAFIGNWTSAPKTKGTGLFLNDRCLAVVGATYKRFTDPVVDNDTVVTIAALTAGGSAVLTGSTALGELARTGDIAPDAAGVQPLGGAKFKDFKVVDIHQGDVAIFAQLAAPSGSDLGVWLKQGTGPLRLVLREGQIVDGKTIKTIVTFLPGKDSPGQGRGALTRFGIGALVLNTDKTQTELLAFPDSRSRLARTGDVVSNSLPDLKFASLGIPAVNDGGEVTFLATLQLGTGGVTKANARGIFLGAATGSKGPVARISDPTGFLDGKFSKLRDPVLNENGDIAFLATQKGSGIKGLRAKLLCFSEGGQTLTRFAIGGDPAGDVPDSQWKSFDSLAITNRGPLFAATLVAGKGGVTAATASGVWACDFTGNPRKLFRTGDTINGKKLAKFTLLKVTVGNSGVTRSFNNNAQVVWLAEFTDKSSAIIVTEVP